LFGFSLLTFSQTTFENIDKTYRTMLFDRRKEKEEYWFQQSVFNYLNLFVNSNIMPRKYTEQDLLDAVYGFIKNRE
jgi:hypothetical protein